jgi:beta-galactosidase
MTCILRFAKHLFGSLIPALFLLAAHLTCAAEAPVSLAGPWRFDLDRADAGLSERWFDRTLSQSLQLPGALQNQGFGDEVTAQTKWTGDVGADRWRTRPEYAKYREPGNVKVPFFLQPEKHYVGPAWYQRDFELPARWQTQRVGLTFERAHWETRVWLDGRPLGTNDSLSTPHVYDLGVGLQPGKHTVTVRIDNRVLVAVGDWAHSVTDHTQGNWNGLIGRMELTATSPVWIDDAQVFPHLATTSATVKVHIGNLTGKPGTGTIRVGSQTQPINWEATGGTAEVEVSLGDRAETWDEFTPRLQQLTIHLHGEQADDQRIVSFGLREIATQDRQFVLNGHKAFFRGTLECCIFPLTGFPPTDVESWKRIIRVCKAHGLNLIRFHSWCPPDAAFAAADQLGFYYQVECGVWTDPGDGKSVDQWIYDESARIVRAYGNHPSFLLLTHGNEPHGPHHEAYLARWVESWKQRDSRRLYTSGSAYPQLPENQYHVYHGPRGPGGWLGKDYRQSIEKLNVPVIVHEMGQWCVYPNFDEMPKYTGPLKPKNFEIFRDSLAEHGMLDQWPDFLRASGRLQVLCYKEEIEAALRTPGIGGFQLLDLHDFPGQGTALVGVLDPFWDSKPYVTAQEFRRFCGAAVPLARLLKRTWTTAETLTAKVELAQFGPATLENAAANWKLVDTNGSSLAAGDFPRQTLPIERGISLGEIKVSLANLPAPGAYQLVVGVKDQPIENDWNVWIYPANTASAESLDVLITSSIDAALPRLAEGGKVLLLSSSLSSAHPKLGFEPIFWNRYMFNTQGRQTLGLLCDPTHPALARFPTEFFQDWQWQEIVTQARGFVLDTLPRTLRPIVQVIDDWNTNRRLGLVWECRVGQGKLLVCSADLEKDLAKRPAARQLRASLLAYASGPRFSPATEVSPTDLAGSMQPAQSSTLLKLGARLISTDSEDRENGNLAAHAIDGNPDTIWHTRWQPANDPMPHYLTIDLNKSVLLRGITCLPRQDQANGRIAQVEIYCSNDPDVWGEPKATARWSDTDQLQTVLFKQPVETRYLKLLVKSEIHNNPFASLAELDVLTK